MHQGDNHNKEILSGLFQKKNLFNFQLKISSLK